MLKVIFPAPPKPAAPRVRQPGDVVTVIYAKGATHERSYTGIVRSDTDYVFILAVRGDSLSYRPYESMEVGTAAYIEFHDNAVLLLDGVGLGR